MFRGELSVDELTSFIACWQDDLRQMSNLLNDMGTERHGTTDNITLLKLKRIQREVIEVIKLSEENNSRESFASHRSGDAPFVPNEEFQKAVIDHLQDTDIEAITHRNGVTEIVGVKHPESSARPMGENSLARDRYTVLCEKYQLPPDIRGEYGTWWFSGERQAYEIENLSDGYLNNIVKKSATQENGVSPMIMAEYVKRTQHEE